MLPAIEDAHAVDIGREHVRVDAEGRTGQNHKVGVPARLQRAEAVIQMKHLGRVDSQGAEGCVFGHAAADGDGARAQEEARFGDEVVRIDGDLDARLVQDGGVLLQ